MDAIVETPYLDLAVTMARDAARRRPLPSCGNCRDHETWDCRERQITGYVQETEFLCRRWRSDE